MINFLFGNPPFKRKSCIFSLQIHHVSENYSFSFWKFPV
ncbi:hypothetical protein CP10139811_1609 [Chlamydia ibidis]|uniref:Uncharacterized protein n=1 Tax=Chlamydia ibidis TaxID=1405396 RepID=S7KM31_9CHLA|nr:hypothetical protein CP10139811_1609 [Chlamydia ibidis]